MNQKSYQGGPRQGGGPQGPGRGPPPGDNESVRDILASQKKVESGYYGPDKKLRPALLDQDAQEAAKRLEAIPTTQLRRFFGQVSAIKRRLDMDQGKEIAESEILAQVAYLKASAAYAAGREKKNAPVLRFLVAHANTIATRTDFLAFHRHFETVVAFHKVYAIDNKQN